jgi:hypothetical protein
VLHELFEPVPVGRAIDDERERPGAPDRGGLSVDRDGGDLEPGRH